MKLKWNWQKVSNTVTFHSPLATILALLYFLTVMLYLSSSILFRINLFKNAWRQARIWSGIMEHFVSAKTLF